MIIVSNPKHGQWGLLFIYTNWVIKVYLQIIEPLLGKIFLLIVRNRINKLVQNGNVFHNSHFGLRDSRSTTDAIFLLDATIQKILTMLHLIQHRGQDYRVA